VEIGDGTIIKCSHESCVKVINKSNVQFNTPSIVTLTRDNTKNLIALGHYTHPQNFCTYFLDILHTRAIRKVTSVFQATNAGEGGELVHTR
jgi:hypothetical protein